MKYEYKQEPLIRDAVINIPEGSIFVRRHNMPQWTCDVISWLQPVCEENK